MQAAKIIFPTRLRNPQERQRPQEGTGPSHPQRKEGRPPLSQRGKVTLLLALTVGALTLCSCELVQAVADNIHTLRVVNNCGGSNYSVDVFVNGNSVGTVTYSRDFMVFTGSATLVAIGTGANPRVFERTAYITGDVQWTLCPSSAQAYSAATADTATSPATSAAEAPLLTDALEDLD